MIATSSTISKIATHRRGSESDVSEDYASLILKPKCLCRKISLNVKSTVLSRKSTNDASNNKSTKHGCKSITPLLNNATQYSEIMGRISNQSLRFSKSKTSEDETNNNEFDLLIESRTVSLGNFDLLVDSNTTKDNSKED